MSKKVKWNPQNPDPVRLLSMAHNIVGGETRRYFIEDLTPYDREDAVQDLVEYILREIENERYPQSPTVAYKWMEFEFTKWKRRRYAEEGYAHHEYLVSLDEEIDPSYGEQLHDSWIQPAAGGEEEVEYTPQYGDKKMDEYLLNIDTETGAVDLTTDAGGNEVGFLSQVLALLQAEGFWDGREGEIVAEAIRTQDYGSGTSQLLKDFRRRKVGETISYDVLEDGVVIISIGEGENVRTYKLLNKDWGM